MSAWLTHDLIPIHGGTYYPPDDRYFGQPGFKSLLSIIATQVGLWKFHIIYLHLHKILPK
jgi:uncharacterized protein YyaL (SSP411 family)